MEKFIDRLKELRNDLGKSQLQLAKETGLSKSAIAHWEIGDRILNAQAIIILARYFKVTTDFLLGEED